MQKHYSRSELLDTGKYVSLKSKFCIWPKVERKSQAIRHFRSVNQQRSLDLVSRFFNLSWECHMVLLDFYNKRASINFRNFGIQQIQGTVSFSTETTKFPIVMRSRSSGTLDGTSLWRSLHAVINTQPRSNITVVRPGSNVELHMCRTELQFRSTQIN